MNETWPAEVPVAQVRIARPTDCLDEVVAFYRDGLDLTIIDSFEDHLAASRQASASGHGGAHRKALAETTDLLG